MSETPLLDWLPVHQRHSPTSRAAAEAIKMHVGPMHRVILRFLHDRSWGATDEEMQDVLDIKESTQRPRRRELQQAGLIADSGKTRKTESGRRAVVWVLAQSTSHDYRPGL
jgi:transcription initiation factor IIE alpha subunit